MTGYVQPHVKIRHCVNNLFHHITLELLAEASQALKRKAVPGVDGIDWYEYGKELPERPVLAALVALAR